MDKKSFAPGKLLVFSLLLLSGLAACDSGPADAVPTPDVSDIKIDLRFIPLHGAIAAADDPTTARQLLAQHPTFADVVLGRQEYGDSAALQQLMGIARSPNADTLMQEIEAYYGDFGPIKAQFELAFKMIKYYYPDFNPPPVYTMITGFYNDLIVLDTAIFVGVDYFMGHHSRYRSRDPDYIFRAYNRDLVVPATLVMLSNRFNQIDPRGKGLINQMVAYGKAFEFARRTLPGTHDSLIMRYSGQQMVDCNGNEATIYAHFVEKNLFFETSYEASKKYLEQRPAVNEISTQCPGRVGTWLGWRIVRSYLQKHPEITLPQLMANPQSQLIFEQSQYRPTQ
jgi:hypothetical protein